MIQIILFITQFGKTFLLKIVEYILLQQDSLVLWENSILSHSYYKSCYAKSTFSYIILDGASYHKAHIVRDLAKELNIKIIFLPAYSRNLNPIERLWKFFKKKVLYNQYYETQKDFTKACMKFFQYIRKY